MMYTVNLCSFTVTGMTFEEAYNKASKRIRKISSIKTQRAKFSFNIERVENQKNTIKFTVFATIDYEVEENRMCSTCKEFHTSFFAGSRYNCETCKYKKFKRDINEHLVHTKKYFQEKLKKKL